MKRRSLGFSLLLMSALFMSGCCTVPPQALSQASDNALITDGFVSLMEGGATTRVQEQAFVLANRKAWHTQNFALNDTPLPADLQPDAEGDNLLEILRRDPRVRAKLKEVTEALAPTPENSSEDGN
jgi:hypothetical protein